MPPISDPQPSSRADGAPASSPAYASAPRRSGLLVALAVAVALAAAAALVMFLFGQTAPSMNALPRASSDEAREAMAAAKAALDEASKSVLQPNGPPPPPAEPPSPGAPVEAPAPAASAMPAGPPGTSSVAPLPDASRTAPKGEAPKTAAVRPPSPASRTSPAAPESVAAVPVAPPAPAPAQVAAVDRWEQMKAELAQCSSTSVTPKLQCERRIRVRYCEGYWGSVPECSTGRTDHGN